MASIKINGDTSGSTTITAPATGSDETIELSTALASKLDLAGGKILQVVRATDSIDRTTTSTSDVDANISVTITPQKSDSAILLLWFFQTRHASGQYIVTVITDSSNNNLSGASFIGSSTAIAFPAWPGMNVGYSTPATTSATTYKGRFRTQSSGTATLMNGSFGLGQLYAIEVSA